MVQVWITLTTARIRNLLPFGYLRPFWRVAPESREGTVISKWNFREDGIALDADLVGYEAVRVNVPPP